MLELPDAWVWDSWCLDDGQEYHLFFLFASRALLDPARRHFRSSIGHAVSTDLRTWKRLPDALVRGEPGDFDDLAVWTGSVIAHPAGGWALFYTGATRTAAGVVQSIGIARSKDLTVWERVAKNPVLQADPRWYETLADGTWGDEAFRDPFVFADESGHGFHMLITARANHGAVDDRGVVGYAWSADLDHWQLRAPLSEPGCGFAQYEVMQVRRVEGRAQLFFSCLPPERASWTAPEDCGMWSADARSLVGPFDLREARPLTTSELYAGPVVFDRARDEWVYLAFEHDEAQPDFGRVIDPVRLPLNPSR